MAYQPQPIMSPWKGIVDNVPAMFAPTSSFKECEGFYIDRQRLKSVPNRSNLPVWGDDTSGPQMGERSFVDVIGNVHTVIVTAKKAYYYVNGVYTLVATQASSLLPVVTDVYQNTLIYTNGVDVPKMIDGSAVSSNITLPNSGTCYFLGKIASRMLYLNLVEQPGPSNYSRRFRWSKVNDANNFVDPSSGVADLPEVEDVISGYATQGALGYIYHTNGITVITPTGNNAPTFYLENYSASRGIGNFYPYSLAQWGNLTAFAAQDDVYAFNPLLGPPQPIGMQSARSIFADLNAANGNAVGSIIPTQGFERQGLQYWLAIPMADNTSVVWMYQFDSQSWTKQTYPFVVTCMRLVAVS